MKGSLRSLGIELCLTGSVNLLICSMKNQGVFDTHDFSWSDLFFIIIMIINVGYGFLI